MNSTETKTNYAYSDWSLGSPAVRRHLAGTCTSEPVLDALDLAADRDRFPICGNKGFDALRVGPPGERGDQSISRLPGDPRSPDALPASGISPHWSVTICVYPQVCGMNGKDLRNKGMRTRLGCLSHKSDSCSDFTAILPDKPNRALKICPEAFTHPDPPNLSCDRLLFSDGVAAFRAFLKTEFSEENLEFWLACEEFKKTRSTAKLVSKAHRIFEEFVDVQAPREVNIDFQTREATRKNMQEPSLTCFDQAQGKVHSLMEKDSYPRFLRSKMYLDLLSQSQRRLS
ncbi:hypothetical protein MJG53_011332 [Ovis ammon polii x Ovis aries]|uniref:Uncharacterized protein n=1 Tax=Ovis ammon polii x Ovis aries TaxID=2918886 RepID=A0ACB9US52_9CETA|nr:hypothetical protein MJG53_011332 [Ovis ammon polii x Ovis aries]